MSFSLLAKSTGAEWNTSSTSTSHEATGPARERFVMETGAARSGVDSSDRHLQLREKEKNATATLQQVFARRSPVKQHAKRPQKHVDPLSKEWDNSVAVCAIMKQEKLSDIREWLLYHQCALPPLPSTALLHPSFIRVCLYESELFQ